MARRPPKIIKIMVDMKGLRDGVLKDLNVLGYYTFGSGQTVCLLKHGTPNLARLPKSVFSKGGRMAFESYPSASSLKSPMKCLNRILHLRLGLEGHISYDDGMDFETRQRVAWHQREMISGEKFTRTPGFREFHKRIRDQVDEVLKDKSEFARASVKTESKDLAKDYLSHIMRKYGWEAHDLQEIVDEVMRELSVESVMKS